MLPSDETVSEMIRLATVAKLNLQRLDGIVREANAASREGAFRVEMPPYTNSGAEVDVKSSPFTPANSPAAFASVTDHMAHKRPYSQATKPKVRLASLFSLTNRDAILYSIASQDGWQLLTVIQVEDVAGTQRGRQMPSV